MTQSIAATVEFELIVKKSRFLARVEPVKSRAEVLQIVAARRAEHPDAAHVCWAFMAGGHSAAADDGEPSGTAGRPMLEVLRHQDLDGVLASVVRYFGGVKLGAGGLVRAYTDSVAQALLLAEKVEKKQWLNQVLRCDYALESSIRHELAQFDAEILQVEHAHDVRLAFSILQSQAAACQQKLNDLARGRLHWETPSDHTA